jgi:chemotaxis protein MotB
VSRRRHAGHGAEHGNAERWLLTYADLITLLMVFFVVLYSMSSADTEKFKRISAALEQAFNIDVMRGQTTTTLEDGTTQQAPDIQPLITEAQVPELSRLQSAIQAALDTAASAAVQNRGQTDNGDQMQPPDVSVGTDKEGIVVRLSGSYLFDSGRAELKPNSLGVLDAVAAQVRPLKNDIRVDGHTDDIPIESSRYPTNWELSAARALAVTRYLTETDSIPAGRLFAAGFGEFRPMVPNDTREHRAMNRRVEIHVLSSVRDQPSPIQRAAATPTAGALPNFDSTTNLEQIQP